MHKADHHLRAGPIDLHLRAEGEFKDVQRAMAQADAVFDDILPALVLELSELRLPLGAQPRSFHHPIAQRMQRVCQLYHLYCVTPMAAVAGAVAEYVLAAMCQQTQLRRAWVNNGGDIALHLAPETAFDCGLVSDLTQGQYHSKIQLPYAAPVRGIATSGWQGRSHSLGIADAVTVLARSAPVADVTATLIANAVDLPNDLRIQRLPACELNPDSDLGDRAVTVAVADLDDISIARALARGKQRAQEILTQPDVLAVSLHLQGRQLWVGKPASQRWIREHSGDHHDQKNAMGNP